MKPKNINNQIFVVDDDESICRVLSILLGTYGFSVGIFNPAEKFISAVPKSTPGCLILDIHMPEMGGWETLRHLIISGSNRPVIIVLSGALAGCNAMRGAGADLSDTGKHISNIGK